MDNIEKKLRGERVHSGQKIAREDPAALRFKGEIVRGHSHEEALAKLLESDPDADLSVVEQGFVTSDGSFVDREVALKLAQEADQVYEPEDMSSDKDTPHRDDALQAEHLKDND
jgi:hypothetical protein